jgi:hypothetical protein
MPHQDLTPASCQSTAKGVASSNTRDKHARRCVSLEQCLRFIKFQRLAGGFNKLLQAPSIDAVSSFNFGVNVYNKFGSRIPALEHDANSVLRDFPYLPV